MNDLSNCADDVGVDGIPGIITGRKASCPHGSTYDSINTCVPGNKAGTCCWYIPVKAMTGMSGSRQLCPLERCPILDDLATVGPVRKKSVAANYSAVGFPVTPSWIPITSGRMLDPGSWDGAAAGTSWPVPTMTEPDDPSGHPDTACAIRDPASGTERPVSPVPSVWTELVAAESALGAQRRTSCQITQHQTLYTGAWHQTPLPGAWHQTPSLGALHQTPWQGARNPHRSCGTGLVSP